MSNAHCFMCCLESINVRMIFKMCLHGNEIEEYADILRGLLLSLHPVENPAACSFPGTPVLSLLRGISTWRYKYFLPSYVALAHPANLAIKLKHQCMKE